MLYFTKPRHQLLLCLRNDLLHIAVGDRVEDQVEAFVGEGQGLGHIAPDDADGVPLALCDHALAFKLLSGVIAAAINLDTDNQLRFVEHLEILVLQQVVELHKTHSETGVRLVGTVILHGIGPSDAFHGI